LADNAGLDSVEILNKLRQKHTVAEDGRYYGVDVHNVSGIQNTYENFVWEPLVVKINAYTAACEAACIILSIDETVRNPKSEDKKKGGPGGVQRGRPQTMMMWWASHYLNCN